MRDTNDSRPDQVILRIELIAGSMPMWVLAAGPDAEEFAEAGVAALRGKGSEGMFHSVERIEGKRETLGGVVPGFEIDLRDATGLAEVERRLSEGVSTRGVTAPPEPCFNEYATWGDKRLETEMHRTSVSMNSEWAHHREHSAKGLRAMRAEMHTRGTERQAVLDAELSASPKP